jgi:hypothetical protein
MTTLAVVVDRADAKTFDEQWATWIAKGKRRDIRRGKQVTAVAIVVACGFALWLASLLVFV